MVTWTFEHVHVEILHAVYAVYAVVSVFHSSSMVPQLASSADNGVLKAKRKVRCCWVSRCCSRVGRNIIGHLWCRKQAMNDITSLYSNYDVHVKNLPHRSIVVTYCMYGGDLVSSFRLGRV